MLQPDGPLGLVEAAGLESTADTGVLLTFQYRFDLQFELWRALDVWFGLVRTMPYASSLDLRTFAPDYLLP